MATPRFTRRDFEFIADCEMQGCSNPATHYGGYKYAGDWAGYICESHSEQMAWRERVRNG